MKRSIFSTIVLAALACAASVYSVTEGVFSRTYRAVQSGVKALFMRAVDVIAPVKHESDIPEVRVVQAKAFQARIEKRERPEVTPGWRMCSSV